MSYSSETFKEAIRQIKARREKNLNLAELRRAEVLEKIPDYAELKKENVFLMGEYVKNLGNKDFDIASLKKKIEENASKKIELLKKNGFEPDYIDDKFDCEKCSDTGYVGTEKCECLKKLLRETAASKSNLDALMSEDNFANFDYTLFSAEKNEDGISPRENMKNILRRVTGFINGFEGPEVKSLLFTGKAGTGKTYLSSCIAKEMLDRDYDVYYQSIGKIIDTVEDYKFRRAASESVAADVERLYDTDLLIIDDLGSEFVTQYTVSAIYELLNKRLMSKKKMIITTNFSLKELSDVYAQRLFSRFVGEFEILEFIGEDLRIQKIM